MAVSQVLLGSAGTFFLSRTVSQLPVTVTGEYYLHKVLSLRQNDSIPSNVLFQERYDSGF